MADQNSISVDIQPIGRRIDIQAGETLLDASRSAGVELLSLCGGEGWCDSCLVRITSGEVNQSSESEIESIGKERVKAGYRLACQTVPLSDVRIDIPPDSLSTPQRLQIEGTDFNIPVTPIVKVYDLVLSPPGLDDLRDDAARVSDGLELQGVSEAFFNLAVLKDLSGLIRDYHWSIRAVIRDREIIALLPNKAEIFGIAVDIGTTKVAVYLVNLTSGEIVERNGEMNPQIAYGEDVISRISYVREKQDGRYQLQLAITDTLNSMIGDMCDIVGIQRTQIVDAVVVGNTAMHHLFAGLPVDQLVYAPYVPALSAAVDFRSQDLGIQISPGAYIHLLPNIAGYIGADHSAVILSTEIWKTKGTVLAIDIGTNTEISLIYKGKITSCSCASGPAFEGAHIINGMRAAPGAIEKVQIIDNEIRIFTIDDQPPVGICGSGILDIVAEMKNAGLMDEKGAINLGGKHIRKDKGGLPELLLVPADQSGIEQDITVSRKDINEIQLAKAAIRSGLDILLEEAGIEAEGVDRVLIAGAFGTYISIPNAIEIGMFPDIPLDRFNQVGNAAGMGAIQALISAKHRYLINDAIHDVEYIELTTYENFQKIYMRSMYLH